MLKAWLELPCTAKMQYDICNTRISAECRRCCGPVYISLGKYYRLTPPASAGTWCRLLCISAGVTKRLRKSGIFTGSCTTDGVSISRISSSYAWLSAEPRFTCDAFAKTAVDYGTVDVPLQREVCPPQRQHQGSRCCRLHRESGGPRVNRAYVVVDLGLPTTPMDDKELVTRSWHRRLKTPGSVPWNEG